MRNILHPESESIKLSVQQEVKSRELEFEKLAQTIEVDQKVKLDDEEKNREMLRQNELKSNDMMNRSLIMTRVE